MRHHKPSPDQFLTIGPDRETPVRDGDRHTAVQKEVSELIFLLH